jgi:hypothetical protein
MITKPAVSLMPEPRAWRKPVHLFVLFQCAWFTRETSHARMDREPLNAAHSIARERTEALRKTNFRTVLRHASEKKSRASVYAGASLDKGNAKRRASTRRRELSIRGNADLHGFHKVVDRTIARY